MTSEKGTLASFVRRSVMWEVRESTGTGINLHHCLEK